jgi:hypothetical protein
MESESSLSRLQEPAIGFIPILSQMDLVYIPPFFVLKTHFNNILPYMYIFY